VVAAAHRLGEGVRVGDVARDGRDARRAQALAGRRIADERADPASCGPSCRSTSLPTWPVPPMTKITTDASLLVDGRPEPIGRGGGRLRGVARRSAG
jgi:hypothetical protein